MQDISTTKRMAGQVSGLEQRKQSFTVLLWTMLFLAIVELLCRIAWDPRLINAELMSRIGPTYDYGYVIPGPMCRPFFGKLVCYSRQHAGITRQELTLNPDANYRRIGVVGESHSARSYSFGNKLSRELNQRCKGLQFETMNLSNDGLGSSRIRIRLEELFRYQPDLVLVNPGGSNEYEDERDLRVRTRVKSGVWSVLLESHAVVLGRQILTLFTGSDSLTSSTETAGTEREASRDLDNLRRWERMFGQNLRAMTVRLNDEAIPAILVDRAAYRTEPVEGFGLERRS